MLDTKGTAVAAAATPPAAALAAISYACGGNVLFLYSNVVYLVGAAWLPWGAAVLERLSQTPSPRALAGFAAALAMMILR